MLAHLGDDGTSTAPGRVIELGCGSATMSLLFAETGSSCTALDREPAALALAAEAARSAGVADRVDLRLGDFLDPGIRGELGQADLVTSGGVIEHYAGEEQLRAYDAHRELSRRWILLGIPNTGSAIFRSFLRWAAREDRVYDEEHEPIDVPALARARGDRVVLHDGCHLFLGATDYVDLDDAELAALYERLRPHLLEAGGPRYGGFPGIDFSAADIDTLAVAEEASGREQRIAAGFLLWYLVEKAA